MTYGQTIVWSHWDGTQTRISVDDCATPEFAIERAMFAARIHGWTPPRWWQWWRWNDTRLEIVDKDAQT